MDVEDLFKAMFILSASAQPRIWFVTQPVWDKKLKKTKTASFKKK